MLLEFKENVSSFRTLLPQHYYSIRYRIVVELIVRLSELRKTILNHEYYVFMCDCCDR